MFLKLKRIFKTWDWLQKIIYNFLILSSLNNKYILFTKEKAKKNAVNLNYCHDFYNIGDNISPIIVAYVANLYGINTEKRISKTRHLYAVGSIITAGAQDCTVWGSGLLNTHILYRLKKRKIKFQAVRGPLSRVILIDQGFNVPEVYGDPAILMPLIYNPTIAKLYTVSVITHMDEPIDLQNEPFHRIKITNDNYKFFIDEIKASELILSSSLHGIIFAESYGVKAILLKPAVDLFKYYDYYFSTGRYSFPIANNISEALQMQAPEIPDFSTMRNALIESFPKFLWD